MAARIVLNFSVCLCLVSGLTSCGGGGGGGGSGSSKTGVRLLHGSIDSAPYDLISSADATQVLATAHFGEESGRRSIGKGDQSLGIGITKSPEAIKFSFPVSAEKGFKASIVLFGGVDDGNLGAALVSDDPGEIAAGMSAVKIINGVDKAAAIVATLAGVEPLEVGFGTASDYVQISPGQYQFSAQRKSDHNQFYSGTVSFEKNKAYSLWVGGEGEYLVTVKQLED